MAQIKTYRVDFWITSGWTQEVTIEVDHDKPLGDSDIKEWIEDNWDEYGNPKTVGAEMDVDYEILEEITDD